MSNQFKRFDWKAFSATPQQANSASLNNVLSFEELTSSPQPSRDIFSPAPVASEMPGHPLPDLQIRVDRPEKILATMDTYVQFRVVTKTRRPEFSKTEYEVRRRYSDFAWLRQQLEQEFPMALLPPLPEKHSMYSLDRFDPIFIRTRCYLLHLFLSAVARQPSLSRHADLRPFLTLELSEWSSHKKKSEQKKQRVTEALYQLASSTARIGQSTEEEEWRRAGEGLAQFQQALAALDKMAGKWHKSEASTFHDMCCSHVVLEHWAEFETDPYVKAAVETTAESVETSANGLDFINDRYEVDLTLPMRHWALYADAVKAVVKKRDGVQFERDSAKEQWKKKELEITALPSVDDSQGKVEQKRTKLKTQAEEAKQRLKRCEQALAEANSELRKELRSWEERRGKEMRGILRATAFQRMQYHKKCFESWEKTLQKIQDGVLPDTQAQSPKQNGTN